MTDMNETNKLLKGAGVIVTLSAKDNFDESPHPEWTYFIAGPDAIKIGRSTQPRARMRDLQAANGSELTLMVAVPFDQLPEWEAHQKFKHLRLHGEWFRPTKELLNFIEALRSETKKPIRPARPRPKTELDLTAKNLYRAMPRLPKAARQFAYNIIEIIKRDTVNRRPIGDHKLQDPKRLLRVQLERFEQAMKVTG